MKFLVYTKNSRKLLVRHRNYLRKCLELDHHHGLRINSVNTFYNGLNENDQDSLNAAAGGNLLSKTTREALNIIENKSKVRYSRNKSNVSRMNTTSRESVSKTDERIDKLADQLSTLVEIVSKKVVTPAPVKAVEEICVTCSGPHAFRDALLLMPRFAPTINSLLMNKEKLLELAKIPLNENCSAMLLKKLPEKLGDPGKFLIPCELTTNSDDLELWDKYLLLILKGLAEVGFIKGALIDVYEEEITLRVDNEAVTFNLNQTTRYSSTYDDSSINRIDVIDVACEEFSQEVLGFSNNSSGGNPTSSSDPILSSTTPAFTPFKGGDFILEEMGKTMVKIVERETEETTDKEQSNFQGSTAHIPPPVNPIPISEPDVPKTLPKPNIPYPSRLNDQKSHEKASNQMEKIFQIFQDLRFDISFADALLLMPRFAPTIKSLLMNKEKLLELAKIPLNENCSAMLLKKLPEKLGDPGKFLIPCNFPGMDVCHALADLGASINLMPLSFWKKLSLPELTPTRMTLELADRSITHPKGLAEDVFVKVGKFYFPTDFVIVDFEADPRVPLILGRSFLRTGRALIDVYGEEITLRVDNEAVTFNLNQTTRYSSTYDDSSINRIDVIDVACEEFSQEVLGFLNNSSGGNPTSSSDMLLSFTTPAFTPFEGGDFILEEMETFLQTPNEFTDLDDDFYDMEGDLKEVTKAKSSMEEPPELELKDLPSHLEYAYLEENDKLPVIIAKGLKDVEKEALLKVLKSHKRAIAWKITDIKGIDPHFCTHKILMEDDYKPTVQSQRRVNPKIHEVIKKEVLKLLDAEMIYPISDSPWVSQVHCFPKKGGIIVVANEENELIPTCLVTGWRVCIDYRKLNEATRRDHFPLPFMDQMLERFAGNEFYCFLD
ncbi:reverse transcriptase domain-containing protein [Tanacetum coccineum]